jgi:hypothetical protein
MKGAVSQPTDATASHNLSLSSNPTEALPDGTAVKKSSLCVSSLAPHDLATLIRNFACLNCKDDSSLILNG